jgi:hypothetical protein
VTIVNYLKDLKKNWILEDIQADLDQIQFGNQKGTGTDHMLVKK